MRWCAYFEALRHSVGSSRMLPPLRRLSGERDCQGRTQLLLSDVYYGLAFFRRSTLTKVIARSATQTYVVTTA